MADQSLPTRRIAGLTLALLAAGCTTVAQRTAPPPAPASRFSALDLARYGAVESEPFRVPAVSLEDLRPRNLRQLVDYPTSQPPGTLVVDPGNRFLYLVQEGGKALRYGVGVGREGLEFTGTATVQRKAQWPRWTPTPDMIRREPARYARWAGGMAGGADNPLGARALYLFKDGRDTLYRIHGTNEPDTIGQAVSSGCIRMMNQDVIDLYNRIPKGARVVMLPA
ncbi:MAG: L,D-transpeptidase [Bosea sp.]|uniref:L,D-transpeptidase n=1 Tax=Bosea sp. (in: a-proteobacteria) TaxID=1871050 RepID=UPI0023951221|nr:L,D-transpeptidase [Bosea sp. (in: a-proteobacteria)]MCP4736883.1 L,D-transpeptidase [Bosea sp. (in: a-proteobacteria)]